MQPETDIGFIEARIKSFRGAYIPLCFSKLSIIEPLFESWWNLNDSFRCYLDVIVGYDSDTPTHHQIVGPACRLSCPYPSLNTLFSNFKAL